MMLEFNAEEVLEMAIRIENNGAVFYRKAAGLQPKAETKNFLEGLARMEDGHKNIFSEMKNQLPEEDKGKTVFDPQDELSLYLASMADIMGGEGSPTAADTLTGNETMEEILALALVMEKDSILFYLGLKDMVPQKYGKDKIDEIILEERRHVAKLTSVLNDLYKE